ncbi:MAG: TolC family protein [Bacteroidetes bacterium]|nr:TolC family protein [Bacteroidota bacterium]MCA6444313.1 TolC family protein [Bacteroidota bacterium]
MKTNVILMLALSTASMAQKPLDKYVEIGIKNSIVLQQKNISLDKAVYSLKEANSLFFPSINLKGDYQSGEGGRQIAIPLGDMLNPVYGTLNQLTMSNSFPQISNVETNFFPKNFYDVKLRTAMPIINADLFYNRDIQKQQIKISEFEIEIYKKELSKNIKVAYYQYLSAAKAISIYENAIKVAQEAKRINEKLLNNGKTVKAYVLRAESEIQNLQSKITSSKQQEKNAQLYFNFLINASNDQVIDTLGSIELGEENIKNYLVSDLAISDRAELKAINQSISILSTVNNMNKNYWLPKLNGFIDLGSQASDWKYNDKSRYYFLGLQLDIPLFAGGNQLYKIKKSKLDIDLQKSQLMYMQQQLNLSANVAKNSIKSHYQSYQSAIQQTIAAKAYLDLIDKGYKEGINTFIETLDARNQLTISQIQELISKYDLMASIAVYEREINK